jgi:hypothetical protein
MMEQPNEASSIAQRDLGAQEHMRPGDMASIPLHRSQSADRSDDLPEPIRALLQLSAFPVAEASSALQPSNSNAGDGIGRRDPWPGGPAAQAQPDDASAARPAIVGVWAPDAGTCSAHDFQQGVLPTVITGEGAWAGDTFCMFTKRNQTETGWTVVAKCSTPRERWTSNVRLTVNDNRLTWTSKRGTQVYTRCSPDVLMAQAR